MTKKQWPERNRRRSLDTALEYNTVNAHHQKNRGPQNRGTALLACYMDGTQSDCGIVFAAENAGATYDCPEDQCVGFGKDPYTGQIAYLQFTADAIGDSGYLSGYDWTQGVNGVNGAFLSNAQYQSYLKQAYAGSIAAQCGTVSGNLEADSGGRASVNCHDVKYVRGGHANFVIKCGNWKGGNCAGRWLGGLHIEGNLKKGFWGHNDTASPYIGSSFSLGRLNVWNLLVHGTADVVGGNLGTHVFPY